MIQETFTDKSQLVEKAKSYPPPTHDVISEHLHPQVIPVSEENGQYSFKHIRDFSTQARRSYVAPELMKWMQ